MHRHTLRYLFLTIALPLATAGLVSGCADQAEGERCDFTHNGDEDCESGLTCVAAERLSAKDGLDRCCPPGASTNEHCILSGLGAGGAGGAGGTGGAPGTGGSSTGGASTGGAAGTAGGDSGPDSTAGTSGTGGTDAGGEACAAPCNFTSECTQPMVCGPQGCCQPECLTDRDCGRNEQCVSSQCQPRVTEAGTG